MNKTLIPALLVATIMVAGAFAFVPVEQASTVHLSGTVVGGSIDAVGDVFIDASTGAVSISSGSEATDDVDGDISIDALLDIQMDAADGISIAAGSEAAGVGTGVITVLAANAASLTSTAGTVTIATTANQIIFLDADVGVDTGIIEIDGDENSSDILRLGDGTTVTTLQKTGANTLTITAATETTFTGDIDATGGFKQMYVFSFETWLAAADQQLKFGANSDAHTVTDVTLPYAGSIIAITGDSTNMDDVTSAETITCTAVVNTTDAFALTTLTTAAPSASVTQAKDIDAFAADDTLSVDCDGVGGNLEGTEDITVTVIVEY